MQHTNPPPQEPREIARYAKASHGPAHILRYFFLSAISPLLMLLAARTLIPRWTIYLALALFHPRATIAAHEMMHYLTGRDLPFFVRFTTTQFENFIPFDLFREEHLSHHAHMNTDEDANFFLIRGSPLQGYVASLFYSEISLFNATRHATPDEKLLLLRHWFLKLVLYIPLIALIGPRFFLFHYYLPIRLIHSVEVFIFFYFLHNDSITKWAPKKGVYNWDLPPWARDAFVVVFGKELVNAVCFHKWHHVVGYSTVVAGELPKVGAVLDQRRMGG